MNYKLSALSALAALYAVPTVEAGPLAYGLCQTGEHISTLYIAEDVRLILASWIKAATPSSSPATVRLVRSLVPSLPASRSRLRSWLVTLH